MKTCPECEGPRDLHDITCSQYGSTAPKDSVWVVMLSFEDDVRASAVFPSETGKDAETHQQKVRAKWEARGHRVRVWTDLAPMVITHEPHHGDHKGYACGRSGPHCWGCNEPWPCRAVT